jgi:peroxiredoxin
MECLQIKRTSIMPAPEVKLHRLLLTVAAGILLAVALIDGWYRFVAPQPAPDVAFTSIKGEQIRLQDLRGKVVLVEFWATTCTYCVRDMPQMADTYNQFQAKGLEMVAVAMSYDRPDYVLDYTNSRKLPFPVALDVQGDLSHAFGDISATPTLFVIGKDGKIVKRYVGEPDFSGLHQLLQQLLI